MISKYKQLSLYGRRLITQVVYVPLNNACDQTRAILWSRQPAQLNSHKYTAAYTQVYIYTQQVNYLRLAALPCLSGFQGSNQVPIFVLPPSLRTISFFYLGRDNLHSRATLSTHTQKKQVVTFDLKKMFKYDIFFRYYKLTSRLKRKNNRLKVNGPAIAQFVSSPSMLVQPFCHKT